MLKTDAYVIRHLICPFLTSISPPSLHSFLWFCKHENKTTHSPPPSVASTRSAAHPHNNHVTSTFLNKTPHVIPRSKPPFSLSMLAACRTPSSPPNPRTCTACNSATMPSKSGCHPSNNSRPALSGYARSPPARDKKAFC